MEELSNAVSGEFNISQPVSLQIFDSEFEDWVTLKSVDALPDKAKLNVVVKGEVLHQHCMYVLLLFYFVQFRRVLLLLVLLVDI